MNPSTWRWSRHRLSRPLAAAQRKLDFLNGLGRGLEESALNLAVVELTVMEAVATMALDGLPIAENDLRRLIRRRMGSAEAAAWGDWSVELVVEGLVDVLSDSAQHVEPLTLHRILAWHHRLFRWDDSQLDPQRPVLEAEIEEFLQWFNAADGRPGLITASLAELWFETHKPMESGSGRLGRAAFDLALARDAVMSEPPLGRLWAVSPLRRPQPWRRPQGEVADGQDVTEWIEDAAVAVAQACDHAIRCIERRMPQSGFWARNRTTNLNARQRRVLEAGFEIGWDWHGLLTAGKAAQLTKVSRVTASRDLAELEALGLIAQVPGTRGRGTRYRLCTQYTQMPLLLGPVEWED